MTQSCGWFAGLVAVLSILAPNIWAAQLMSTCAPDSPERRGQIGCTVFPTKPLPEGLTQPVFWHIDRPCRKSNLFWGALAGAGAS